MSLTLTQLLAVKITLCVLGLALAAGYTFVVYRRGRFRRTFFGLSVALALLGVCSYHDFAGFGFVGYWDLYHYYLGSKYSKELGWDHLYGASIAADAEGPKIFRKIRHIRDNRTQQVVPVRQVLAQAKHYKEPFSPERWQQFKRDLRWFQHKHARWPKVWGRIFQDRGYNPTPVWDRVGSLITSHVPLEAPWAIPVLVWLDRLLLLAALAAIAWAYGPVTMLLFLIAWGCNPLHLLPIKGAFLRLDWLAALLVGAACFKKERYVASGALLAYAAMARVFPLLFAGGVVLRAAWELVGQRRVLPWARRFALGFVVAAGLLAAAGTFNSANEWEPGRWQQFREKITVHLATPSNQRSGLQELVGREHAGARWAGGLLLIAAFAFAARRLERDRLVAAGLVPLFVFVTPASYYLCVVSILVLLYHRLEQRSDLAGLASLFCAYGVTAGFMIQQQTDRNPTLAWLWSLMMLLLALVVLARAALAGRSPHLAGERRPEGWRMPRRGVSFVWSFPERRHAARAVSAHG